jgi:outer membrane protein assembly factor BamB
LREDAQRAYDKRKAAGAATSPAVDFGQTQAVSADGKLLLAATPNGWQLWDTRANTNVILENTRQLAFSDAVRFSADGALLAVYDEGWFWLWKTDGTRAGSAHIPFATFNALAFSPHNMYLALADDGGEARQWKVAAPLTETASVIFPGYFAPWRCLSFAPDLTLAATDRFAAKLDSGGFPHWFATEPIKAPAPFSEKDKDQTRLVIDHIAAAPDGKSWAEGVSFQPYFSSLIMRGFPSSELRARDAKTGQILWRQEAEYPMSHLEALQFLPDGALLSGGVGHERSPIPLPNSLGGLQVHDARNGESTTLDILWDKQKGHIQPNGVTQLLADRDGKRLVVSSDLVGSDVGIQVIDLTTKTIEQFFGGGIGIEHNKWALSPDGRWLGIAVKHRMGVKDCIYLRDLSKPVSGHFLKPVRIEVAAPAQAISFNNDGSFAVGLQDGRVLTWAANPTADSQPVWETKPGRAIDVLQFSTDGKTLWSGDERGDLVTRNADDGQWKSTLRLLPPADENAAPSWVRWARGGKTVLGK